MQVKYKVRWEWNVLVSGTKNMTALVWRSPNDELLWWQRSEKRSQRETQRGRRTKLKGLRGLRGSKNMECMCPAGGKQREMCGGVVLNLMSEGKAVYQYTFSESLKKATLPFWTETRINVAVFASMSVKTHSHVASETQYQQNTKSLRWTTIWTLQKSYKCVFMHVSGEISCISSYSKNKTSRRVRFFFFLCCADLQQVLKCGCYSTHRFSA